MDKLRNWVHRSIHKRHLFQLSRRHLRLFPKLLSTCSGVCVGRYPPRVALVDPNPTALASLGKMFSQVIEPTYGIVEASFIQGCLLLVKISACDGVSSASSKVIF